jgi:hypothetical protein
LVSELGRQCPETLLSRVDFLADIEETVTGKRLIRVFERRRIERELPFLLRYDIIPVFIAENFFICRNSVGSSKDSRLQLIDLVSLLFKSFNYSIRTHQMADADQNEFCAGRLLVGIDQG